MKIGDRQTLLQTFETKKAESTGQTQTTNKTVSDMAISALDRALAGIPSANTQKSSFAQGTQRKFPKGDMLPPGPNNPPSRERIAQCVDDAFRRLSADAGKEVFPKGPQRTELIALGEKMALQGKSAYQIELALADKARADSIPVPSEMKPEELQKAIDGVVDAALKSSFPDWPKVHPPQDGSQNIDAQKIQKLREKASEMVKENRDLKSIRYALTDSVVQERLGLTGKPDEAKLGDLFTQAMKSNWPDYPADGNHGIDRETWMAKARAMADDNMSATNIRYAMTDGIGLQRQGLTMPTNPGELNTKLNEMLDEAFKSNGIDPKNPQFKTEGDKQAFADRAALLKAAQDMAGANKDLKTIRQTLTDMITTKRQGLEHTDTKTLNRLVDEAFKEALKDRPDYKFTAADYDKLSKQAFDMAGDGADAKSIRYAMNDGARAIAQGFGSTNDDSLRKLVTDGFAKVYEGQPHAVSQKEMDAWFALAKEMAAAGKDAKTISYAITDGLRTSIQNQVHIPGEPNAYW